MLGQHLQRHKELCLAAVVKQGSVQPADQQRNFQMQEVSKAKTAQILLIVVFKICRSYVDHWLVSSITVEGAAVRLGLGVGESHA